MERRKNYMAPFWSLIILLVLKLGLFLYVVITLNQREFVRPFPLTFILPNIVVLLVLTAETVAYWYMRKLKYRRFLAWWHVGLWYVAILMVPLILVVAQLSSNWLSSAEHEQALRSSMNGIDILYWTCIIFGHLLFVGAIAEGIKNRSKEQSSETSEILGSV
jgi:hypothetical protein